MKKKMVKKLISVSLVSAMAVSMLAACGGGGNDSKEGGGNGDGDSNVLKVAAFEGVTELRSGRRLQTPSRKRQAVQ